MNIFNKRLKRLRIESGLTQRDIANLLGVGITTISNYETGRNEPSIKKLIILAKHFEVSVDYLIGNSDNQILEDTQEKLSDNLGENISKLLLDILVLYNKDTLEFNSLLIALLIEIHKDKV